MEILVVGAGIETVHSVVTAKVLLADGVSLNSVVAVSSDTSGV